jgi:hypothetical protein
MKMIEVVNEKLEVMVVPPGRIPNGWKLYTERKKFPSGEIPEGTDKRPASLLARLTGRGMCGL